MSGKLQVVVGGQFGSEGKGAIAAHLCREGEPLAIRVAGPNAGHSAVDWGGHKRALRQIPVGVLVNRNCRAAIAAGSEIDPDVLVEEVTQLEGCGIPVKDRLFIDASATMIEESSKLLEQSLVERIGSTGKGIGAARAARIMRTAHTWSEVWPDFEEYVHPPTDVAHMAAAWLGTGRTVLVEGTQGYGLGLHAGYYPKCTSSDCRAIDFLSMAGITPWAQWVERVEVWVVLRTYPIRVAGDSGPLLGETSWEELGRDTQGYIKPEYTTVTKKERRVGTWDPMLANRAVMENGGKRCKIALTFFDYWFPELAGVTDRDQLTQVHWHTLAQVERDIGAAVTLVGTGPNTTITLFDN